MYLETIDELFLKQAKLFDTRASSDTGKYKRFKKLACLKKIISFVQKTKHGTSSAKYYQQNASSTLCDPKIKLIMLLTLMMLRKTVSKTSATSDDISLRSTQGTQDTFPGK